MTRPLPRGLRSTLARMPADTLVRVYTHQDPEALACARRTGYLTGSAAPGDKTWQYIADPMYEWMRARMSEAIPGFSGDLPVWCWLKRRNPRQDSWIGGTVRITALVPRGRMVLSNHRMWEWAMNGGPLTDGADECERWYEQDAETRIAPEDTWHRLLNIEDDEGDDVEWIGTKAEVQACVDRIHLHEIVSVREIDRRGR